MNRAIIIILFLLPILLLIWHFLGSEKTVVEKKHAHNIEINHQATTKQSLDAIDNDEQQIIVEEELEAVEEEIEEAESISYLPDHVREDGVNLFLKEHPNIQLKWMDIGREVVKEVFVDKNVVDIKDTYYHRSEHNRQMTCGRVKLENSAGYQRYIYAGTKSVFLESEINDFDIVWQKLCVNSSVR